MRILISIILIGSSVGLITFSKAQAETCDSLTSQFTQVLKDDGFANPVLSYVDDVIQITVESDYEPISFSHIIRKGYHSRTYRFKRVSNQHANMPESCVLEGIKLSFQPIDKYFIERTPLSAEQCSLLVENYNKEVRRRDELMFQRKNYLPLVDSYR